MARLPADEDYARALLSIFQARNVRPRQSLRIGDLRNAFLRRNMGRAADFDAALEYAESQRWVAATLDWIRLSGDGDEEMHTIAGFYPDIGHAQAPSSSLLSRWLAGKLARSA